MQTIGVPSDDLPLPEVDAVVVSLKSRSIEASLAVTRSRAAEKWLRGRGADHVLFKICSTFDSTDAGNIGPVMDALRDDCGDAIVLVTPAFPETGRTVYQGNLFVGSVPLNESPLKDHPLNPMHDSNLVRVLARQSKTRVGLVDLADIARGPDAVRAQLADLAGKGFGAAIADAVFERDLETIGKVALDHRVSVGASGHRARARPCAGRIGTSEIERVECAVRCAGRRARGLPRRQLFAGDTCSKSPARSRVMPVLHLDPERVVAGRMRRGARWPGPGSRLNEGPILIASSSTPDEVAALQSHHGRDAIGHAIEQAMADIAEGLVESGVRRLVVAGGETSGAVVDRLEIPGFLVGAEISPPVSRYCAPSALKRGRDAAGTEIRQFRRRGIFLRCARADALRRSSASCRIARNELT